MQQYQQQQMKMRRLRMGKKEGGGRVRTFGELVVVASQKNKQLNTIEEPLLNVLLQKGFWRRLQNEFDACKDKTALVRYPSSNTYDATSPSPFSITTPSIKTEMKGVTCRGVRITKHASQRHRKRKPQPQYKRQHQRQRQPLSNANNCKSVGCERIPFGAPILVFPMSPVLPLGCASC
eukprot:m.53308 g.53308  ORF g.53308 m.53308 type:complete len:178 (+) comp7660_c0_seq1:128-661(+)